MSKLIVGVVVLGYSSVCGGNLQVSIRRLDGTTHYYYPKDRQRAARFVNRLIAAHRLQIDWVDFGAAAITDSWAFTVCY